MKRTILRHQIEQIQRLHHPIHTFVLGDIMIIFGEGDYEYNGINALEALDPFPAFGLLATHVVDLEVDLVDHVAFRCDLGGADTADEDAGFGGFEGGDAIRVRSWR